MRASFVLLAVVAALGLVHCAGDDDVRAPSGLDASAAETGPATTISDASVADAEAAVPIFEDDPEAGVVAAQLSCRAGGCATVPDAGDGGLDCVDTGAYCICGTDGCTGGPGVSIAVCPYRYTYCVALAACVTRARYYAQCPY